jgi:integrase
VGSTPQGKAILRDFYGRTRDEALEKFNAYLAEHPNGPPSADQRQPLNDLMATVVETVVKYGAISTYEDYLDTIALHVAESIGPTPICELNTPQIQRWYNELRESRPRTAEKAHAIVRSALNYAIEWGILQMNAAAGVKLGRRDKRPVRPLTFTQTQALIEAAYGRLDVRPSIQRKNGRPMKPIAIDSRLGALYELELRTGLRRGELLALRWSDVDWERCELRVSRSLDGERRERTTKTAHSVRAVPFDTETGEALKAHRAHLQAEAHREGWKPDGLIFPSEIGTPMLPRNLLRHFATVLAAAGLPKDTHFHDLRHTAGSLMLAEGANLVDVSRILGHSSPAVTANIYAHSFDEGRRSAVAGVGRRLRGKKDVGTSKGAEGV